MSETKRELIGLRTVGIPTVRPVKSTRARAGHRTRAVRIASAGRLPAVEVGRIARATRVSKESV